MQGYATPYHRSKVTCSLPLLHTSYTKPKGQLPDYTTPVVLQQGKSSVEDLCNNIHKGIMREFKQ